MSAFLLIYVLFSPQEAAYKHGIASFKTMEECHAAQLEVAKNVRPQPGIYFVLTCVKSKPTDGTEV